MLQLQEIKTRLILIKDFGRNMWTFMELMICGISAKSLTKAFNTFTADGFSETRPFTFK